MEFSSLGLTSLSIAGLYLLFVFLFSRNQHFQFNRFFILMALVFSFVFPFISIDFNANVGYFNNHFQLTEGFWEPMQENVNQFSHHHQGGLAAPSNLILLFYGLGVILFLSRYSIKLFSILKIIRLHDKIKFDSFTLIKLKEGAPTFSFGNYIFSDQIPDKHNQAIFDHEKCHVHQRHTYDLLLVELLLALQWFNPFIYLFKSRLAEVHEFLADEHVLKKGHDKVSYMHLLCSVSGFRVHPILTSSFHSNTLKRIKTMNQHKVNQVKAWKAILPLVFGIVIILIHSGFVPERYELAFLKDDIALDRYLNAKPTFQQPIEKSDLIKVTSRYGMRMHPVLKEEKMHLGIDYSAERGVNIYASLKGTVREAGFREKYGNIVIIDHSDGFSTLYAQMESIDVKVGDVIPARQVVGTVGSSGMATGPHLHFEIMKDGKRVNPDDYLEPYQ